MINSYQVESSFNPYAIGVVRGSLKVNHVTDSSQNQSVNTVPPIQQAQRQPETAQYIPMPAEYQNATMAKTGVQAAVHGLAVVAMLSAAPLASAAGFEADAKDMANKIYKGIYGFVGVVALIIVLWQCVYLTVSDKIKSLSLDKLPKNRHDKKL